MPRMTRLSLPAVVALVLVAVVAVATAVVVAVIPRGRADAVTSPRPSASSPRATPTPTPTPVGPARVVTIGDSIMAGYGLDDGQAWPDLLAAQDGESIANVSCSGAGFIAVGGCGTTFDGLL